tara:strand:- start:5262 stop:5366 length:105 start_codon:yes stop_codon:yes gene_type:complete
MLAVINIQIAAITGADLNHFVEKIFSMFLIEEGF